MKNFLFPIYLICANFTACYGENVPSGMPVNNPFSSSENSFEQAKKFDFNDPDQILDLIKYLNFSIYKNILISIQIIWTNDFSIDDLSEILSGCDNVKHLVFKGFPIGPEGAKVIARSPHMKNLRHLDLTSNNIHSEGMETIVKSPNLKNLESLNLTKNFIEYNGVKALKDSGNLWNLKHLNLSFNSINDKGAQKISDSPILKNLESLDLSNNNLGEVFQFYANPNIKGGVEAIPVNLRKNIYDDLGVVAIANSPYLRKLKSLNLSGNTIREAGSLAISKSQTLKNLQHLNISNAKYFDIGKIAQSQTLTNLQVLDVRNNQIFWSTQKTLEDLKIQKPYLNLIY